MLSLDIYHTRQIVEGQVHFLIGYQLLVGFVRDTVPLLIYDQGTAMGVQLLMVYF